MTHGKLIRASGVVPATIAAAVLFGAAACLGQEPKMIAWADGFEQGKLGAWEPYGAGCAIPRDAHATAHPPCRPCFARLVGGGAGRAVARGIAVPGMVPWHAVAAAAPMRGTRMPRLTRPVASVWEAGG